MITRIRELLDSKELSPTQFADLIGIGRPVVSHILSERNKPSLDVVQRIIGAFPEISLPWLLSGTGSMLADTIVPAPSDAHENNAPPTPPIEAQPAAQPVPTPLVGAQPALISPVEAQLAPTPPPVAELPPAPRVSPMAAPRVAAVPVAPAQPAARSGPDTMPAPSPAAPSPQPFRAPRFVPAAVAPLSPAPPQSPAVLPSVPATDAVVAPAANAGPTADTVVAPAAALPPASSSTEALGLPLLLEPGKAIRRIVIFYRDGSFADYQPE